MSEGERDPPGDGVSPTGATQPTLEQQQGTLNQETERTNEPSDGSGDGTGGGTRKEDNDIPVFVNEDLTKSRSYLLWTARKAKRNSKIQDCWTIDGNVMIKDNRNVIRQVKNLVALNGMIN